MQINLTWGSFLMLEVFLRQLRTRFMAMLRLQRVTCNHVAKNIGVSRQTLRNFVNHSQPEHMSMCSLRAIERWVQAQEEAMAFPPGVQHG